MISKALLTFWVKYENLNFAKKDPGMELDPRFIFPRPWPRHCSVASPRPGLGPGSPVSGTITITSVSPSQQSGHQHQLIKVIITDKTDKKSELSR